MTTTRREPTSEVDRPLTLAERARRGWFDNLVEGFSTGTDVPSVAAYYDRRAAEAICPTCKTVGQEWFAYTDGGHTRIYFVCPACQDSREICEPMNPIRR